MLELVAAAALACAIPTDLTPAPALPQEESRIVPVEHFVLAYYWWPQECRRADSAASPGCHAGFGLRVHGLWPDGPGTTYPQFCRAPTPLAAAEVRRNWCLTPSVTLLQHEWAKHGTCDWPDAAHYFADMRRVAARIALPDLDRVATAGAVRDAMVASNPRLPRDAVFVGTDSNQWLTEIRVCLNLAKRPRGCESGVGAPDSILIRVWPR